MYVVALLQGRWWCPMCGPMGSWGWSMMIVWVVILAVIVVVGWYLVRGALAGGLDSGRFRRTEAEEILRQRYARGEIDRDTYLLMREDLRRPPPG